MPAEQQILTLFVDYFAETHVDNIEKRVGPGFTNKLASYSVLWNETKKNPAGTTGAKN